MKNDDLEKTVTRKVNPDSETDKTAAESKSVADSITGLGAETAGLFRKIDVAKTNSDFQKIDELVNEASSVASTVEVFNPTDYIGPYKLVNKIGSGGMGDVWQAKQTEPDRMVAIKVIRTKGNLQEAITRFEFERQSLSKMNHANIAWIFDGGTTDAGNPYLVMEFVEGLPFDQYCDSHRLPLEKRLRLFTTICKAIQHAHQKGILHRDLKPANVLVTEIDGEPTIKVIDFGIAYAIEKDQVPGSIANDGGISGTWRYMSPEQAAGSTDIDTRTDVYSLGAMFFELLTGTTPIQSTSKLDAAAIIDQIKNADPC